MRSIGATAADTERRPGMRQPVMQVKVASAVHACYQDLLELHDKLKLSKEARFQQRPSRPCRCKNTSCATSPA